MSIQCNILLEILEIKTQGTIKWKMNDKHKDWKERKLSFLWIGIKIQKNRWINYEFSKLDECKVNIQKSITF